MEDQAAEKVLSVAVVFKDASKAGSCFEHGYSFSKDRHKPEAKATKKRREGMMTLSPLQSAALVWTGVRRKLDGVSLPLQVLL